MSVSFYSDDLLLHIGLIDVTQILILVSLPYIQKLTPDLSDKRDTTSLDLPFLSPLSVVSYIFAVEKQNIR